MRRVLFLSVEGVLKIHLQVIHQFGGDPGLRDRGLLASAVAMPQASFDGKDLHGSLVEKAAAYHFHLCTHHPFLDGNKRVAVVAAELFLWINGHQLPATDAEIEKLTMGVASGQLPKDHVSEFFATHVKKKKPGGYEK